VTEKQGKRNRKRPEYRTHNAPENGLATLPAGNGVTRNGTKDK